MPSLSGSSKILSKNGIEIKNQLFTKVATLLGVEHKIYSAPNHLSQTEELEGFIALLRHVYQNMCQNLLNWTK